MIWIGHGIVWFPQSMVCGSGWQTVVVSEDAEFSESCRQTPEHLVIPVKGLSIVSGLIWYAKGAIG